MFIALEGEQIRLAVAEDLLDLGRGAVSSPGVDRRERTDQPRREVLIEEELHSRKQRLRARATLARQAEILSPVMPWKPEELVLNAEIYQGDDSSITEHWKKLTKGLPGFEERLSRLREWYWARYAEAAKTPREQWDLAQRLAEAGRCDRAEAEFARATSAEPTLAKPGAVLVDCRERARRR